jgi:hypothetical protein
MSKHITRMILDEAPHYAHADYAGLRESYPAHEREARMRGVPTLGSGLVYPVLDETIACEPFALPRDWPRIVGLDFGYEHPFAAVDMAWNRDADILYVVAAYREQHQTPIIHAAAVKPWGAWLPCAWPHDGLAHDKGSADQLASLYAQQGLNMLAKHATHEEGGNGVEAGVTEILDRMKTGRFKVFRTLGDWFSEKRGYHRKNGLIVKQRDDLLDATRTAVMMRRFARTEPKKLSFAAPSAGGWLG